MQENEEEHLRTLSHLVVARRARPSVLLPVASSIGFVLGAATGLLGREAAMACTVAVETAIGNHYTSQIRELLARGHRQDEAPLLEVLARHRDEELAHLETGLEEGAERAPLYGVLTGAIRAGCAIAIEAAKRF